MMTSPRWLKRATPSTTIYSTPRFFRPAFARQKNKARQLSFQLTSSTQLVPAGTSASPVCPPMTRVGFYGC